MSIDNLSNSQILSSLKACAKLDIELCDEENLRCYRYHPKWSDGVQVVTYENGGGDDLVIVFKNGSVLIKGFDHESEVSPHAQEEYAVWPGMYEGAPEDLMTELDNQAFEKEDVTFCFWRDSETVEWQRGSIVFKDNEDDGSEWLLSSIKANADEYIEWGRDYYEDDFNRIPVERINEVFSETE